MIGPSRTKGEKSSTAVATGAAVEPVTAAASAPTRAPATASQSAFAAWSQPRLGATDATRSTGNPWRKNGTEFTPGSSGPTDSARKLPPCSAISAKPANARHMSTMSAARGDCHDTGRRHASQSATTSATGSQARRAAALVRRRVLHASSAPGTASQRT